MTSTLSIVSITKILGHWAYKTASIIFYITHISEHKRLVHITMATEYPDNSKAGQTHPNESPDMIASSLEAFDRALTEIRKGSILDHARSKNPSLFHDNDFRLMFLRTEVYNSTKAAQRFVRYFEKRVDLFGPELEPLTQECAMRDDLDTLAFGYLQAVPKNDRLLFFDPASLPETGYNVDAVVKSVYYVIEKQLKKSEELQRKGVIYVVDFGGAKKFDRALVKRLSECTNNCIPLRNSMTCITRPPFWTRWVLNVMKLFMKPKVWNRIKVIWEDEDLYELTGVTIQDLFNNDHEAWIKQERDEENANK